MTIKDALADFATWRARRHIWWADLCNDIAKWLSTAFKWRAIRARRDPDWDIGPTTDEPRVRRGER